MRTHPLRRLGLAVVALLVGAPLLWSSAAQANPTDTVTFGGGCALSLLGPLGKVTPSADLVTVQAGDQLKFVNALGTRATLSFDGEKATQLPSGGTAGVTFQEGPVTVTAEISCLLGGLSGSTRIEVTRPEPPAPSQPPASTPSPTPPDRGDGSGSDTGSGSEPPSNPVAPPDRSTPSASGGDPAGNEQSQHPPAPDNGAESGAPSQATDTVPNDLVLPRWSAQPEPDSTSPPPSPMDSVAENATGDESTAEFAQTAGGSGSAGGSNGMLALIATICVAGVTAGAIRTIIAQRAARAEWA